MSTKSVLKICARCLLFATLLFTSANSFGQQSHKDKKLDRDAAIANAREEVKLTEAKYQRILNLSKSGSASQQALRRTKYNSQIAKLNLSNLLNPAARDRNSLLAAKLKFRYTSEELDVTKALYKKGSASKIAYQRAVAARDVAASKLKSLEDLSKEKFHLYQAAKSKFAVALSEYETAKPLVETGAISKATFELVESRFKTAESELAAQKKKLGARATVIKKK